MGPEFHQTVMGRQFYEQTMPQLVKELRELKECVKELTQMVKTGIASDAATKEQPKS
jgi:hypothetical protein